MTRQTDARAGIWGQDATDAADEIRAVQAREQVDGDGYYGGPDEPGEPVISQDDLDERAEMAYERWLDERWSA